MIDNSKLFEIGDMIEILPGAHPKEYIGTLGIILEKKIMVPFINNEKIYYVIYSFHSYEKCGWGSHIYKLVAKGSSEAG